MPNAFNFAASPFDCLTSAERQLVRGSVDIGYFREGATILEPGVQPAHLFVVIKGHVRQLDGEELVNSYGPDDCFDGRALVAGQVGSRFVAGEEVLVYQLAKQTVTDLILRNAAFGAMLFADLSKKLSTLAERDSQHELQSLSLARVEQAVVRPASIVDGETDIVSVVKLFQELHTSNVLVRDARSNPPRLGVFTTTGLQRAILHGTPLTQLPVRELANFSLVTVRPGDRLFDALALMIRHKVHRVVVVDGERVVGFLEQLDLLSFLSNHSYLITRQILESQSVEALAQAAEHITRLIGLLHRGGTQVSLIARLVQELNAQLFERAWQLIAPADLVDNSCLFVMGSEGRGEQVLKTDQDNGLVLRDGYVCPHDLAAICQRFSDALADFGYPECPGHIMLSNPQWRLGAQEFGQAVRRWLLTPDAESLMALAIFLDAHAVCGDASLLEQVRAEVFKLVTDNDVLLAHFAAAIDAFENVSGWWNRLFALGDAGKDRLDLKKAGNFPLVHGIRSMALEMRLPQTGTVERIEALVAAGKLPAEVAPELVDSLHFFMEMRLKVGLDALELGHDNGRSVDLSKLSSLDRDLLKDALSVVKRFKAMLRHRYRLDML
ncbi:MAG: putative nucleotidyltransferase substrate binding domain-containing protein [Ramlibacter sp.]